MNDDFDDFILTGIPITKKELNNRINEHRSGNITRRVD